MKCPFHHLRSDLPPLTKRIAALPVDERGYPVPFFVMWIDGKPDFRIGNAVKLRQCVHENLCWVCGQPLGQFKTFPIGPMCAVNRTSAEPPSHKDCSEWSVVGCPFLSKPKMVRRVDELTRRDSTPGIMIERNPGVTCLWTTKSYKLFRDGKGGTLFEIGDPVSVTWWREGRTATRLEILESIDTGLPLLVEQCRSADERESLQAYYKRALKLLPP